MDVADKEARLDELLEDLGAEAVIAQMSEMGDHPLLDTIDAQYLKLPPHLQLPAVAITIALLMHKTGLDLETLRKYVEVVELGPQISFLAGTESYRPGPGPE